MSVKQYAPVGRCIYCRVNAEDAGSKGLSAEHIIPFSLGGNIELPEASCNACTDQTHAFEGRCAGGMFLAARTHFGWRSRKSKRPKTLKAGNLSGPKAEWREVPATEHPPCIMLPSFAPPGILIGRSAQNGILLTSVGLCFAPEFHGRFARLRKGGAIFVPFAPDDFCRLLCKIAHAYAVAQLGLDTFKPFLNNIILGTATDYSLYVGNTVLVAEQMMDKLHTLSLGEKDGLIIANVRLYARYGAPTYSVVVGRRG